MNETDYNARLYEKMKAEQDKYRDRLLHPYEYTMRVDIVMEEASVCGNVTIYGGEVSNSTCLFALDMILLVCVLKRLERGDIFAERQQRNKEENTDRMRPSLSGTGV